MSLKKGIGTLRGHSLAVYSVEFAKTDRPILARASADGTIKLWDPIAYGEIRTLTRHTDAVISLATSPDGKILACGSADTTIKRIQKMSKSRSPPHRHAIAWASIIYSTSSFTGKRSISCLAR